MDRSFATPIISPRLPAINGAGIAMSTAVIRSRPFPISAPLSFVPSKNQSSVRAAKPKTVRHHAVKIDVIKPLPDYRHIGEGRVKLLYIRRLAYETVIHHEERVNRLLHPCGPKG